MANKKEHGNGLKLAILSLSLLTVMAGAAVAPALQVIMEYFSGTNPALVQMIISIPAIFIVMTNLIFPRLAARYRARTLLMAGLLLYVVGGCIAGLFSNIYLVLAMRAFVGVGVGIIMPMSTGLLSFYYTRDKQDKLMGYSSAMNQLGGSVATLIAGFLASISWRASFLVYLMGLISVVLCLLFLPNDRIGGNGGKERRKEPVFSRFYPYIVGMFLLMFTFFVYPADFAIETAAEGVIPHHAVSVIMALLDVLGFFGGLAYAHIRKRLGNHARFVSPVLFAAGYLLLAAVGGWVGTVAGSFLIGFASGSGIPFLISSASQQAGRAAATTVLPLISAAMYLAQFLTPMILSVIHRLFDGLGMTHLTYWAAVTSAVLFGLWSFTIRQGGHPERVQQEEISLRRTGA